MFALVFKRRADRRNARRRSRQAGSCSTPIGNIPPHRCQTPVRTSRDLDIGVEVSRIPPRRREAPVRTAVRCAALPCTSIRGASAGAGPVRPRARPTDGTGPWVWPARTPDTGRAWRPPPVGHDGRSAAQKRPRHQGRRQDERPRHQEYVGGAAAVLAERVEPHASDAIAGTRPGGAAAGRAKDVRIPAGGMQACL